MSRVDWVLHVILCNTSTREISRPIALLHFACQVEDFSVTPSEIAVLGYINSTYLVEVFHLNLKDGSYACYRIRVGGAKVSLSSLAGGQVFDALSIAFRLRQYIYLYLVCAPSCHQQ
jgi:hypothetical protein